MCPAICYGAAEVAPGGQWVAWLLLSGAPPAHSRADSSPGTQPKKSAWATKGLSKAARAGPYRAKTGGPGGGPGSAGRQRGAVPPLLELGLTEAWERGLSSLLRPRPCTAGRPQGRALIVPVSPRHPGGSAGPQRSWRHLRVDAGSPRPVREPGLSPSCLTASSRPRNPTPATCVVPLLD